MVQLMEPKVTWKRLYSSTCVGLYQYVDITRSDLNGVFRVVDSVYSYQELATHIENNIQLFRHLSEDLCADDYTAETCGPIIGECPAIHRRYLNCQLLGLCLKYKGQVVCYYYPYRSK